VKIYLYKIELSEVESMSTIDESQCWLKALSYILSFHQVLSAMVMSRDVSQVGVTLLPSF